MLVVGDANSQLLCVCVCVCVGGRGCVALQRGRLSSVALMHPGAGGSERPHVRAQAGVHGEGQSASLQLRPYLG